MSVDQCDETQVYTIRSLAWDADFFGISIGKVSLHRALSDVQWALLKRQIADYQLVVIDNADSSPRNARLLGTDSNAFLTDVNVRFTKVPNAEVVSPSDVVIRNNLDRDQPLVDMAVFPYSRFTEDPGLLMRGGRELHREWVRSSLNRSDKYFALAYDRDGRLLGFLLHSYSGAGCTIELICVDQSSRYTGVGTRLFSAVEATAHQRGCSEIVVGTQIRNTSAINFYIRRGCLQSSCHQIYHLWNSLQPHTHGHCADPSFQSSPQADSGDWSTAKGRGTEGRP